MGRTLLFLKIQTSKSTRLTCQRNQAIDVDGSDAFLRLRKDKLIIPKEFYLSSLEGKGDMAYANDLNKPDIPQLRLPKNAADEWRQKLIIERQMKQKPPSLTPSDKYSLSEIQSEARSSLKIMSSKQPRANYLRSDRSPLREESLSERRPNRLNLSSAAAFSIQTPTSLHQIPHATQLNQNHIPTPNSL